MKKIELLSPVGSLANLKAAIVGGADAVYLGLPRFNAREYATNFNKDYFLEAVKLCKSNNIKIYLTVNTLIKNSEIKDFFNEISFAYENGIDAVILQDPSFIPIIKSSFPGLLIHLSTQAGIMNSYHANLFTDVDRIVLARELSKESLQSIRKNYKKELEVFVHGALCVCVSGSCLFSSFVGGRSGNRGKCSQPCRRIYNGIYYLSTKELSLIEKVPELIKLNLDSLKIEGRMRTPYYVNTVTSIYRKAIEDSYSGKFTFTKEMKDKLESAFSRDFTEGCYSGKDVFNRKSSSGISNIKEITYNVETKPIDLKKRTSKLIIPEIKNKPSTKKQLLVRVYNKEDAISASKNGADIVYYDIFAKDFLETKNQINVPLFGVTPRIMFDKDVKLIQKEIKEKCPQGLLAGNLGILNPDLKLNIPLHLDYNLNCFNDINLEYLEKLGAFPLISPELSIFEQSEFKNKNFASLVHGNIKLMTLAHKIPDTAMKDEKNFKFHINKIYNGSELTNEKEFALFNKAKNLLKAGINNFFIDTDNDVENIVNIYRQIIDGKTVDVSKIKNRYVLGWSERGVL